MRSVQRASAMGRRRLAGWRDLLAACVLVAGAVWRGSAGAGCTAVTVQGGQPCSLSSSVCYRSQDPVPGPGQRWITCRARDRAEATRLLAGLIAKAAMQAAEEDGDE